MNRFQFRMENILSVREKLEEKRKQEYTDAFNKLQKEIELKQLLINKSNSIFSDLRKKMLESISLKEIIISNNYVDFLKSKIIEQEQNVLAASKYAEKKRQELIEASKQKKMLEKLKEKYWLEYLNDINKEEQKSIDEIISFQSQNRLMDRSETNS